MSDSNRILHLIFFLSPLDKIVINDNDQYLSVLTAVARRRSGRVLEGGDVLWMKLDHLTLALWGIFLLVLYVRELGVQLSLSFLHLLLDVFGVDFSLPSPLGCNEGL